jgi:hypothetical protein
MEPSEVVIVITIASVAAATPAIIAKLRKAKRANGIALAGVSCVLAAVFTYETPLATPIGVAWLVSLFWSILDTRQPATPKVFKPKPLLSK